MTASNSTGKQLRLFAALIVFLACLLITIFSALVFHLAYREPDSCSLLAMGRWIAEHHTIPPIDPFSYGYSLVPNGKPYIVFQWLADLAFYEIAQWGGPTLLMIFASLLMAIAFIAIPIRLFAIAGANMFVALLVTLLVMSAVFTRHGLRPEMFSFIFTAILLEALARLSSRDDERRIDYGFVILSFVLLVLWTNTHYWFPLYFFLIGPYAFCLLAYALGNGSMPGSRFKTAILSLVAGFAATLTNPYFFSLWPFTLKMFSDPINRMADAQPFSLETLRFGTVYPWVFLAAVSVGVFYFSLRKRIQTGAQLFFLLLIPAALFLASQTVLTLPIGALFMCAGIAFSPLTLRANGNLDRLGKQLANQVKPLSYWLPIAIVILSVLGTNFWNSHLLGSQFPQTSASFKTPARAIKYLEANRPSGNMLNDAQYGAVMMWQMKDPPEIFIDTRYFIYDKKLLSDYRDMVSMRNDWEALLDRYKISWVFLPVHTPLAEELAAKAAWTVIYSDDAAAIIARKDTATKR